MLLLRQKSYLYREMLFSTGIQAIEIASSGSKSIWNLMLMRFKHQNVWEKLRSLKFIFNCHVKTVALMICLKKLFFQVCAIRQLFPTRSRSRLIGIGI